MMMRTAPVRIAQRDSRREGRSDDYKTRFKAGGKKRFKTGEKKRFKEQGKIEKGKIERARRRHLVDCEGN